MSYTVLYYSEYCYFIDFDFLHLHCIVVIMQISLVSILVYNKEAVNMWQQ